MLNVLKAFKFEVLIMQNEPFRVIIIVGVIINDIYFFYVFIYKKHQYVASNLYHSQGFSCIETFLASPNGFR